jgi:hypothetical protein
MWHQIAAAFREKSVSLLLRRNSDQFLQPFRKRNQVAHFSFGGWKVFRNRAPQSIHPDAAHAHAGRARDIAREAVTDHYRRGLIDIEAIDCEAENLRLRLAESHLARNQDQIEKVRETRADDLRALNVRGTVGDHGRA